MEDLPAHVDIEARSIDNMERCRPVYIACCSLLGRPLTGYYNGVRNLVPYNEYELQNGYNLPSPLQAQWTGLPKEPPLEPVVYDPYPDYNSEEYRKEFADVERCYLDADDTVSLPDVYVYPGLPQHLPDPFYGSYSELGLREDVCFDRFGRYGPYGYGYDDNLREHSLRVPLEDEDEAFKLGPNDKIIGMNSEKAGSEKVFDQAGYTNWSDMDWGTAQRRCFEKNQARFDPEQLNGKRRIQRHAYVLRTWTGYTWSQHQVLAVRAMINELALKSGGEYDVHFLVHVKNSSIPIWADVRVYNKTLQDAVPKEFWNMTTLWSEQQMALYYPDPFPDNFANMVGSELHGVYRSAHFALQWFSREHPEYDFFWNWEMDVRYSGHYYELNSRIGEWAKKQPRKGLWERNRRFWFPKYHGDYQNFTKFVEQETAEVDVRRNDEEQSGPVPIWGPVQNFKNFGLLPPPNGTEPPTSYEEDDYVWGVGEDADLIVFNPIFDPSRTNWVFRTDVTGYNRTLPIPPRRAAIITVSRMSKRLLDVMHEEVWRQRHTMFPEMWAPTVCMHHGLKAVYAPHPVYMDRDWDLATMDQTFNYPRTPQASVFGWGENNLMGSTFYYNSAFSPALWRRWLGQCESKKDSHKRWQCQSGKGGRKQEEAGAGRMCLRSTLHHPVKFETWPDN
ncbi:hypothetical protein LTR37_000088 [Vermiconidia calcicola]|uniref:Uncharacterized protein n=1 Tax=Vermiconidia calcicola TaxID=1690605 RepID=A0ACC3NZX9_9PEZI|nr:hypothetical protein LTR37_000088 [Vermiconidia calcicola]